MSRLRFTILGCGSSGGVPRIGNIWGDCDPANPKNRRLRCSMLVERITRSGTTRVLIDTTPDMREQLLRAGVGELDAVVYTHSHADHTHGLDDLRHVAASRLVLDNIPHLKAYWVMVTPKLAQIALSFGADDLDGTVVEETIYHMAGAETAQQLTRAELERIVRAAGFEPVERDTLYRPVHRAA